MGQMRTQNLQRQGAEQELEQGRLKLDSQKALLAAMVGGGGDFDRTMTLARESGKVLPGDLISLQEHRVKMAQDAAALDKTTRENTTAGIDQYRGLLQNVQTPEDLAAANARAEQMGIPKTVPRHVEFSDPEHVKAFANGLVAQSQALKEAESAATRKKEEAAAKLSGVQTTVEEQKAAAGDRDAAIAEIQAAQIDPGTGTPTPAAWAQIRANHPKLQLPPPTDKDAIARFVRSGVPVEKQPEYDINAIKAKLGLMGNSEFDQYQLRYAQSLNKRPADLNFPEFQKLLQMYAQDKQDPNLLATLVALRGSQTSLAQAQVQSVLTPDQIREAAQDLLTGDFSPDQLKDLRAGRINQSGQIISAARKLAEDRGEKFSLFDLEQQATAREGTLKEFTNTGIGHVGGQRLALNTLIHHADLYMEAARALKNGNFKPGNQIYNTIATMFGASPPTNAALLAQFFASETGKVATGGVPAEGEIKSLLKSMATDGSPQAMEDAGRTLIGIAAGRMIPMKDLRDKARLNRLVDILGPDAREILTKRGFDPETMKPAARPAAGTGGLKYIKKAVGPNNHEIGQTADGKWHDTKTGALIP